jgi:3-deoxy-D-manno-octulosonate 8-phosphate phosphatase (KDO 8-P phosphatase)
MNFKVLILDVDGVMTTGQFLYSETGKQMKVFGPYEPDRLLAEQLDLGEWTV